MSTANGMINQSGTIQTTADTGISYNMQQLRLHYVMIKVRGKLDELLADAYVETTLPQIIQSTNCYEYIVYLVTANQGQITLNINKR